MTSLSPFYSEGDFLLPARCDWDLPRKMGGLLRTFPIGGNRLECYYHHFFTHDAELRWLAEELGIGEKLEFLDATSAYLGKVAKWQRHESESAISWFLQVCRESGHRSHLGSAAGHQIWALYRPGPHRLDGGTPETADELPEKRRRNSIPLAAEACRVMG